MRKTILATMLTLLAFAASGQVKFGVRAGGAINSLSFNVHTNSPGDIYETSSRLSYVVGANIDAAIPKTPLSVDASVLFSWRTPKVYDYSTVSGIGNGEGIERHLNRGYMEFPILLKWKIINNGVAKPYIATGPNFTFLCGKTFSDPFKKNGVNTAWHFSAGVMLANHFSLDFSYGLGLAKAFERIPANVKDFVPAYAKDRFIRATLTYYFN